MKSSDRTILFIIPVIAVVIGFWLLVVAPKQRAAGDLGDQVTELQSSLSTAQSEVAAGKAAQGSFRRDYADVVALGAAAPADDDQATLVYDMSKLGEKNDVSFRSFEVTQDAGSSSSTPAPTSTDTTASGTTTTDATATDATATEATAASLPLGATVGPAGLPVVPYDFNYFGNFFDVASLFGDIDDQVQVSDVGKGPDVSGRLMTIDGFALTEDPHKGFPFVQADFSVSTYLVPDEQGVDAGASEAGPGVATTIASDSTADGTSSAPATAAVTP